MSIMDAFNVCKVFLVHGEPAHCLHQTNDGGFSPFLDEIRKSRG